MYNWRPYLIKHHCCSSKVSLFPSLLAVIYTVICQVNKYFIVCLCLWICANASKWDTSFCQVEWNLLCVCVHSWYKSLPLRPVVAEIFLAAYLFSENNMNCIYSLSNLRTFCVISFTDNVILWNLTHLLYKILYKCCHKQWSVENKSFSLV